MNWLFLIPLAALVASLVVSALVFGRRRQSPVNVAFLLFIGAWAFWLGLELLLCTEAFQGRGDLVLKLMIPFWTSLGFLYLNFAYELVGRRRDAAFYAVLALTLVSMAANLGSSRVTIGYEVRWWGVADLRDPLYHTLVCVPSMLGGVYGVALLIRRYLVTGEPSERRPFLVFLIGSALTLGSIVVANVVLPNAFGLISFARYGSATAMFFLAGVYVAATRFQFLGFTVDDVAAELFEDHPDGVVLLADDGAVLHMNAAARALFARGGEVSAGSASGSFLPPEALAVRDREILFPLATREGTRAISASAPHLLPQSRRGARVLIFRDETEEQEARAVLRRSRDGLEREVQRRTEEVMRVQRLEALGALAGGIGHDFNNLLTATMGFAAAARDELGPESPLREDLEEILLASRRGREIVRQMLTFREGTSASREKTDVVALADEAAKLLSVSCPPGVVIERSRADGPRSVVCDPTRLHQVFMNIGINALLAMKETGGVLRIGVEGVDVAPDFAALHPPLEPGRHVRVGFDDSGVGMDEETLGRVFEPFFTTRRSGEGSGLGLATALQIARELGGAITVESELGRGTAFAVYLSALAEGSGEEVEGAPVRGGEERVLFVDDREQVVRMGRRLLSSLGYAVTAFTDPNAALEELERRKEAYDIIVTDLAMPGMSGIALGARARRLVPGIRLVLVTGNLTRAQRDAAVAAGFDGALQKPLAKEELAAELRRILDRPREVI